MERSIQLETPMEFFKELIEEAMEHQRIESSQDTAFYLVQLLAAFIRPERVFARAGVKPDRPLAEIFCTALSAGGVRKLSLLRLTGDLALFFSGFLSESLNRRLVDVGYYTRLGGRAYGVLGADGSSGARELFEELAVGFVQFADVLSEVSERCAATDAANLMRLYERWLATGSRRSAKILRREGILVVPCSEEVN